MRYVARLLLLLAALASWPAFALDKVTLQLKWTHAFQFAGYYAAQEKGYYREAGLAVRIVEAAPGSDPVSNVLGGQAEYGVGTSSLLLLRNAGKPVVALGVIFQHSPYILLSRQHGPIQSVHDLDGKRVMLEPQAEELLAYLKMEGIPLERVIRVEHSFDLQDLVTGKVDAISAYVINQPYYLDRAHYRYQTYSPRSAGIDFYGDNLFTTEQELKLHPERVKAFRAASLRGWQYAMSHPEEIADLIRAKYTQQHSRDYLLFQARQMLPLIRPELIEIGYMYPGRWRHIAETYVELGMLTKDFSLDGFLYEPNPQIDLSWLYRVLAGALLLIVILIRFAWISKKLRLSEERYRGLFNHMANGFALHEIICDHEGKPVDYRFLEVNPSFEKMTGLARDKWLGKRVKEVLPDLESYWIDNYGKVALTGEPEYFENYSKELGQWFATYSYRPAAKQFAVVVQNISARKLAEIALNNANIQLQQKLDQINQLQDLLRDQAMRDALTGLYNRRYLDETLERELSRARRESYPLCLLMIDLDHFKKVNDSYGHQAGDEVLRMFSALLSESARAEDIPCRYGGEEFLLLLPKMPLEIARQRAEQLRAEFAARVIKVGQYHIQETLSVGIAAFPDHGTLPDELTRNADLALYQAKQNGRNCVVNYAAS